MNGKTKIGKLTKYLEFFTVGFLASTLIGLTTVQATIVSGMEGWQ